MSKIPIPSVGTKITKKPIINAGRGNNGTPSNVVVRKVKLIKTGQDNTKVSGGNNNRKPTMAILKNIQSYVKQNIVKPVQSESITASKPKAMTRVGVPKKGGANNAVQTAAAIASNPAHPRSKDVRELLNSYEKGWVEEHKFKELLQGMVV